MAGIFNEAVLTKKGIALLAKAQAGQCTIQLTKAVTGNGSYSDGEDIASRTKLKSQKQEFSLETVTVQNVSNVFVKFVITNRKSASDVLKEGYYVKEIGLCATDPDESEILYAIATAVTDQWDYMPSYNDLIPSTITVDILTEVANASEVIIEAPNYTYFYDEATGDKYVIGINNGLLYYEEVESNE